MYFRTYNAVLVVNGATWIFWELAHGGKPKDCKLADYMAGFSSGWQSCSHVAIQPLQQRFLRHEANHDGLESLDGAEPSGGAHGTEGKIALTGQKGDIGRRDKGDIARTKADIAEWH